jgi:predicted NACHT family NTPase
MQKADYLLRLMKQRTDALVATDEKLQQFLMWVSEKSLSVEVPYKPAAVRSYYFALDRTLDRTLVRILDPALDPVRTLEHVLDPVRVRTLNPVLDQALDGTHLDYTLDPTLVPALDFTLDRALERALVPGLFPSLILDFTLGIGLDLTLDPELRQALQQLREQLPNPDSGEERFKQWEQAKRKAWTKQLREMMIKHRNIGHDRQFSNEQRELLKQYYQANKLLIDCLNNASTVTPEVRSHIEETLLLPIAEIEQRGSC